MRTEDGVSAVVGGILIMTIVLISITIILLSGGPLVEETNARANFVQAAQSFGQLKATASQLATNPQSAAATWRMPAIPGSLNLESRGDRVLVVASNSTTVRLSILAWENSDDWVVVHVDSLLPPTQFSVRAWSLSGGVTE
ncbi:MAG TPA: hypothetical protein VM681_06040, partial [Candidatus Thermoplasmatota archaeon]|nr:hypothetical protein [Candidatus Thermoplasmatota archaeon]